MPGISPDVINHKLSISTAHKPVRQKRRSYDAERYEAMRTEVDKLKAIGFIREATYLVWLANSVMVVDVTAEHDLLSFMDTYLGYNQIFMDPADREHTAFNTDRGLYCYNVMQGSSECRTSVPTLRVASTSPGRLGAKASPILPSARDHCSDKPAPLAGTPKARYVGPIGQMGNRVGRI
ncbi:unnamed protein product [Prunus armeniaca]